MTKEEMRDADFDLQLTIAIEEQMEAERYFIETLIGVSGVPEDLFANDLLSEPLLEDELTPQEYEEMSEVPITEEQLFHIIKETEISEHDNLQYE